MQIDGLAAKEGDARLMKLERIPFWNILSSLFSNR